MRVFRCGQLFIVALALTLVGAAGTHANAEGFFSKLLNWGGSRRVEPRIEPPPYHFGYSGPRFEFGRGYGDSGWPQDNARYRTLCVRTCDGFYFPIGDNVGRERLHQDARTCEARCDGEARLYYYPTSGGSPETMVDLAGRPYAQTPTAFLYRKTLVQGCACKPAPWSAESAARHRGYKDDDRMLADMRESQRRYAGRPEGDIDAYLMRENDGPQQSPWDGGVRRY